MNLIKIKITQRNYDLLINIKYNQNPIVKKKRIHIHFMLKDLLLRKL